MDAVLNGILSEKGIVTLTMLILLAASLAYCRIVTGMSPMGILRMIPALAGSGGGSGKGNALADGLKRIRAKTSARSFSNPTYEDIALTGGDGRGTVSEVLAQQTEMKLMRGEEVDDEFTQDLTPGVTGVAQYEAPLQETEPEEEMEPVPDEPEAEFDDPPPAEDGEAGTEETVKIEEIILFDGFTLGDTYEATYEAK